MIGGRHRGDSVNHDATFGPVPQGATIAALGEVVAEMHSSGPGEKTRRFNEALIADYRATGGKRIGELPPSSTVLITMKGARTGRERIVPVGVEVIEGRMVVVASASGIEKNPQWFHNIVANPRVTVEWQGDTFAAEAVVTEGADRDHLFSKVNEVYRNQQAQSSRTFPVIELRRLQ
jgi:deazaflavin-dependent oxidoreductase (nitroreductase family)